MSLKRQFPLVVYFFIQFVECIKCSYTTEKTEFGSWTNRYPENSLKTENKGYYEEFQGNVPFQKYFGKDPLFQIPSAVHPLSEYGSTCNELTGKEKSHEEGNAIKEELPFDVYKENKNGMVQKTVKSNWTKSLDNDLQKNVFFKFYKRTKSNRKRTEGDKEHTVMIEQVKSTVENFFSNSNKNSSNDYENATDEHFITEKMIEESKNICDQILMNSFHFLNAKNIYNSGILQLFKKPIEKSDTGKYDLFGFGEMKDVSAIALNEAINNIKHMKQWNKFIKEIKRVNINKEEVLQKKNANQLLNVNDHFTLRNDKYSDMDVPQINSTNMKGVSEFLYQVNELPWPFKNRDVIYEKYSNFDENKNMFTVINRSVDNVFLTSKNMERIKDYRHFFCIYPQTKDTSQKGLKYVIYFYYNSDIPCYVQFQMFRQLIPSLIFNLYAFVQHKLNKKKRFAQKERQRDKRTPTMGNNELEHPFIQEKVKKEVKDDLDVTSKKQNAKEKKTELRKTEENVHDITNTTVFKKGYFTKLKTLWENRKENFKKMFFFFYHLF